MTVCLHRPAAGQFVKIKSNDLACPENSDAVVPRVGENRLESVHVHDPLAQLLQRLPHPKILLVGDVMLDRYLWGDVDRISPEAPIPILNVTDSEERLGGAGSVAAFLRALDAEVVLATVLADDMESHRVRELLERQQIRLDCTLVAEGRSTTVKQRLLGRTHSRQPHQILRLDRECPGPIGAELITRLLAAFQRPVAEVDLILVSDYAKGVCSQELVSGVVSQARAAGMPVVVDPARGVDYERYRGCTAITPNRVEAGMAAGLRITTPKEGLEAARRLLNFGIDAAVVTLDRDGIAWYDKRGRRGLFPVRPRQVFDITGAGDMVLAALGYGLAAGADWPLAIQLANLAGGLEVEKLGVTPLTRWELLAELAESGSSCGHKLVSLDDLERQLGQRRSRGQRIVMTNGCFDLLHPGHVASLQFARTRGDCLVVAVNSDQSVAALKGAGHPLIRQQERAAMLAALACVDYVVVFDDPSVAGLVERLAPDVLVKSAQYAATEVVGHESVLAHGGEVVLAPMVPDYSTSSLIRKIREMKD